MPKQQPIGARNLAIFQARRAGVKYSAIAAAHGISAVRARQIYVHWAKCFVLSGRPYFVPPELLEHDWTPEAQWAEFRREAVND